MLSEQEWESIVKTYEEVRKQKVECNNQMLLLRKIMNEEMPEGTKKIITPIGNVSRYERFSKWIFSKETEEKIEIEKENGTAKRVAILAIGIKMKKLSQDV